MMGSFAPFYGDLTKKKGLNDALGVTFNNQREMQGRTYGERNNDRSFLAPGYQGMAQSQGYSPSEKSSIEQQSINPIRSVFGSARSGAANRMARTNNSAGYGSFLGDLAQKEGESVGGQSQRNQLAFADEKQRRREAGLSGIAQLYGVDTSFLNSLQSGQQGTLDIGNDVEARRKGVLGNIMGGIGVATGLFGKTSQYGGLFG